MTKKIAWNKGLTKRDPRVRKYALSEGSKRTQFKKGHNPWNKDKKLPQISGSNNPFYGKHHTEETKKMMREKWSYEKHITKKWKESQSKVKKELYKDKSKHPRGMLGKHLSKDAKRKISESKIGDKNPLKRPEVLKKVLRSLLKRPTKPEQKLIEIIQKSNLPFKYVGNGSLIIEGYNPDFIDNDGSKRIIEVFGKYWHKLTEDRDKKRIKTFAKYGFSTLVIWDYELNNEEKVVEKINQFCEID